MKRIERVKFPFDGEWFGLPSGQHLHLVEKPDASYRDEELVVDEDTPPDIHFALRVNKDSYDEIITQVRIHGSLHVFEPFKSLKIHQFYVLDPNNHIIEITALTPEQREIVYLPQNIDTMI